LVEIVNEGTVTGNLVSTGIIAEFANYHSGRFDCGSRVELGPLSSLYNFGILSPGGSGSITCTNVTGNILLSDGGTLEIDIAGSYPGGHDSIAASGTLAIESDHLGISDFVFRNLGGLTTGTYKLITSTGIYGTLDPADLSGPVGSRVGTLQINGGDLELVISSSGLSPYLEWTGGPFAAPLHNADTAFDFDQGGLPTGIEWVVGGDPTNPHDDAALAPTFDTVSDPDGKLLYIFRRSQEAHDDPDTTITAQYSNNMTDWTTALHQGSGSGDITISGIDDGYGPGIDKITIALPAGLAANGRLFVRLNVVVGAP
jgi:hypothetical protein